MQILIVSIFFIALLAAVVSEKISKKRNEEKNRKIEDKKIEGWTGMGEIIDFDYDLEDEVLPSSKPERGSDSSPVKVKDVQSNKHQPTEEKKLKRLLQNYDLIGNSLLAGQITEDIHQNEFERIDKIANQFCERLKTNVLADFNKYIKLYRELC